MNKRGSTFMLGLMFSVMLFIAVVVLIEPIKDTVVIGRSSLDCDNSSISAETEATCIAVGAYLPVFVLAGVGVALAAIGIRRIQQGRDGGL